MCGPGTSAYRRDGTGAVGRLDVLGGPPLGIDELMRYRAGEATLAPGDRLLVLTDGFTEAHSPQATLFGDDRVAAFMAAVPADETDPLTRLVAEVRAFEAGRPAFDDMAALLVTFGAT